MARRTIPEETAKELFDDEPIVLMGHPEVLQGDLHLKNPLDEKIKLRDMRLRQVVPEGIKGKEPIQPKSQKLRTVLLRPGQQRRLRLTMGLEPNTPPGEYRGEIEVAGRRQPVVLYVTEMFDIRVAPQSVVVENLSGQNVKKRIVVSNRGNVPLTIGEIGAVPLDDEQLQCRTLRAAAAAVGDEIKTFQEYLAIILYQAKVVMESSGALRVRNLSGTTVINPGEIKPVDLEIRVPDGLDKRSRFRGVVALYTANLEFLVVPVSGGQAKRSGNNGNSDNPRNRRKSADKQ
jgi:hypothetical protein